MGISIFCQRLWKGPHLPGICVDVEASDNIDTVLAKIAEKENSPDEQFSLQFHGIDGEHLKRGKTLSDYNISEDIDLLLRWGFDIVVVHAFSGNMFKVPIEASMQIGHIKDHVLDTWLQGTRPWPEIKLIVGLTEMKNDEFVADYKLKAGSLVHLIELA